MYLPGSGMQSIRSRTSSHFSNVVYRPPDSGNDHIGDELAHLVGPGEPTVNGLLPESELHQSKTIPRLEVHSSHKAFSGVHSFTPNVHLRFASILFLRYLGSRDQACDCIIG